METPNLRILVVLPMSGGSLPIGVYCENALKSLGHLTEVFNAPAFVPAFDALKELKVTAERLEHLEDSFLQVVSQAVYAKVQSFQPDMVLALAQAPLSRQILKRLRRDGVPTAMWFVEDYSVFTYWRAYAPYYDIFAVIQKEPFLAELAGIGVAHPFYLPLAADPQVHAPLELTPVEKRKFGANVSFMGAGYPNRRVAFRHLLEYDLKIWGTEWENDAVLTPYVQLGGARISTSDAVRIFNATKINLNLHSSMKRGESVVIGDFVNPRTFELAACGAFQLTDKRALLPDLFSDEEIKTFANIGELKDMIAYYLAHEDERELIAGNARERVLREHTYASRMKQLTEYALRNNLIKCGRCVSDSGNRLPAGYEEELIRLAGSMGLSAEVSFNDLVWAVRSKQGKLSDLECAILFLDEWRKLYAVPSP